MIRVKLPHHLQNMANVGSEVILNIESPVTQQSILDALENRFPVLRGTIRDHVTHRRRPYLRFFASGEDVSHEPPDAPVPDKVALGEDIFIIVGAIAGG